MVDSNPSQTRTIDLRGVRCPNSTMRLKKVLKVLDPGQKLIVISNDDDARADFPGVIKKSNATFAFVENPDGDFTFEVTKG